MLLSCGMLITQVLVYLIVCCVFCYVMFYVKCGMFRYRSAFILLILASNVIFFRLLMFHPSLAIISS
jgi:hypothetical protein